MTEALSRTALQHRVRWVVAFTITYNVVEAVVAIIAGSAASSGTLVGFGLDSSIEVASAVAVAWQFSRSDPERWETGTLKAIAVAFFALALYVGIGAVEALSSGRQAEHSTVGVALTALSVVIMPAVSYVERDAGRKLGSSSVVADSRQTLMCAYLSAAVLLGLVLNWLAGWWWADPSAGLVIAVLAVREGVEAWRGDGCALSTGRALGGDCSGGDDQCC